MKNLGFWFGVDHSESHMWWITTICSLATCAMLSYSGVYSLCPIGLGLVCLALTMLEQKL